VAALASLEHQSLELAGRDKEPTASVHFNREFLITSSKHGVKFTSPFAEMPSDAYTILDENKPGMIKTVTSDDEGMYMVTTTNKILETSMRPGRRVRTREEIPEIGSCHGQIVKHGDLTYIADPKRTSILEYMEKKPRRTIQLKHIAWPTFLAVYNDRSLVVSGHEKVGLFPISRVDHSIPIWIMNLKDAAGVCVDNEGLIFVALNVQKAILGIKKGETVFYTH